MGTVSSCQRVAQETTTRKQSTFTNVIVTIRLGHFDVGVIFGFCQFQYRVPYLFTETNVSSVKESAVAKILYFTCCYRVFLQFNKPIYLQLVYQCLVFIDLIAQIAKIDAILNFFNFANGGDAFLVLIHKQDVPDRKPAENLLPVRSVRSTIGHPNVMRAYVKRLLV